MEGGLPHEPMEYLLGAPVQYFQDSEENRNWLLSADQKEYLLSAGTKGQGEGMSERGIVAGHAYTLIKVAEDKQRNKMILKMRNPWGSFEWNGEYAEDANTWTDKLKKEADFVENKDDGIFFMTIQEFVEQFNLFSVCCYKPRMQYDFQWLKPSPKKSYYYLISNNKENEVSFRVHQPMERIEQIRNKDFCYFPVDLQVFELGDPTKCVAEGDKKAIFGYFSVTQNNEVFIKLSANKQYLLKVKLRENKENQFGFSCYSQWKLNLKQIENLKAQEYLKPFYCSLGQDEKQAIDQFQCDFTLGSFNQNYFVIANSRNQENRQFKFMIDINGSTNLRIGKLNKTGETQIELILNLNNKQDYSVAKSIQRNKRTIIKTSLGIQEEKPTANVNQPKESPSKKSEAKQQNDDDDEYGEDFEIDEDIEGDEDESRREEKKEEVKKEEQKEEGKKEEQKEDEKKEENEVVKIQHQSKNETNKKEVDSNSKLSQILKQCEATGELFCDSEFPAHVDSITLDKSHKYYNSHFAPAEWLRPTELFKTSIENVKLFDYIDPNDIKQGCLGNCYFLATLSSLAEFPDLVESIFLNSTANKYGAYSVIFYSKGIPTEIVLDDRIPCKDGQPLFSKPEGNELWVMLLEKAWAKFFGNYTVVEGGLPHESMEVITGQPSFSFSDRDEVFKDINKLGDKLLFADQNNYLLCAGTKGQGEGKSDMGIVAGHAYTMISVYDINSTKLLKMRNPWGQFEWKGMYSDNSNKWTEQLKQQTNFTNADDGQFHMTLEEFKGEFNLVSVSCIRKNYQYSYEKNIFERNHAKYYLFSVKKTQDVCFRVHQVLERYGKIKDREYKYAGIELQLFGYNDKEVWNVAAGSENQYFGDQSVFGSDDIYQQCEPGSYCLRIKVLWEDNQLQKNNEIIISSYSQEKLSLTLDQNKKGKSILETFYKQIAQKEAKPIEDWGCTLGQAKFASKIIIICENKNEKKSTLTTTIDINGSTNMKFGKKNRKNELLCEIIAGEKSVHFAIIKPTIRTSYALSQQIGYSFRG